MSKKRDKEIQTLIRAFVGVDALIGEKPVRSFSVDADGGVYACNAPPWEQASGGGGQWYARAWSFAKVGFVKPFKHGGWRKHLYNSDGRLYCGETK